MDEVTTRLVLQYFHLRKKKAREEKLDRIKRITTRMNLNGKMMDKMMMDKMRRGKRVKIMRKNKGVDENKDAWETNFEDEGWMRN